MADLSVYSIESASAQEAVDCLHNATRNLSVYQAVSAVDSFTGYALISLATDPRAAESPRLPVWKLSGSFNISLVSRTLRTPFPVFLGQFGSQLDGTIPVGDISATIQVLDYGVSGSGRVPIWTLSGGFAGNIEGKIPVPNLTASFVHAESLSLNAAGVMWRLSAAFQELTSMTLSRQTPVWIGQGEMSIAQYWLDLHETVPVHTMTGMVYQEESFNLSTHAPVWKLDSTLYQSSVVGTAYLPTTAMTGRLSQVSRFLDYVLSYVRP